MTSKYHAKKVEVDGIVFDSVMESKRYLQLKKAQLNGEITDLQLQVPFILIEKSKWGRQITYIADFVYYENGWNEVVEDVKGVRTPVFNLKARLFAEKFGKEISIWPVRKKRKRKATTKRKKALPKDVGQSSLF